MIDANARVAQVSVAPYYLRLGYELLANHQIGPELARTLEHGASLPGIDASLRCAMIKPKPREVIRPGTPVRRVAVNPPVHVGSLTRV